LLEAGVTPLTSHALAAVDAAGVRVACAYTEREHELACDCLVTVTARLPEDGLAAELEGAEGGPVVRLVGDAWSPGTIAAAVWDGHRYAQELDGPAGDPDRAPFLEEKMALAPADLVIPAPS